MREHPRTPTVVLHVRLPQTLADRVKALAEEGHRPLSRQMELIVEQWLTMKGFLPKNEDDEDAPSSPS